MVQPDVPKLHQHLAVDSGDQISTIHPKKIGRGFMFLRYSFPNFEKNGFSFIAP